MVRPLNRRELSLVEEYFKRERVEYLLLWGTIPRFNMVIAWTEMEHILADM